MRGGGRTPRGRRRHKPTAMGTGVLGKQPTNPHVVGKWSYITGLNSALHSGGIWVEGQARLARDTWSAYSRPAHLPACCHVRHGFAGQHACRTHAGGGHVV